MSHTNEIDVYPGADGQGLQVAWVRSQDGVPICREQHDRGVDHVGPSSTREQHPCAFSEILVERQNLEPGKETSQRGLTR